MNSTSKNINIVGRKFSKLFMNIMFNSVHGWKQDIPERAEHFYHLCEDGSKLEGAIHYTQEVSPKGIVILCHPFMKYGMHYFIKNQLDLKLAELGFHVVMFNFKGFGQSNIKGHAFYDDVLSIGRFTQCKFPNIPIHLLGTSFGGFHLSHALGEDSSMFKSVVLDSVPCSVTVFFKKGLLARAMKWISNSKLAPATGTQPIKYPLDSVSHVPIAFLYGLKDEFIRETDVQELKSSCEHIELFSFPDCGHLGIFKVHEQKYLKLITKFFTENSQ